MNGYKGGYKGVILRVDLCNQEITKESLNIDYADMFIGGRGLNLKYLYNEIEPGIDPLGPDNLLILGTGPCNGTLVPGSQRFTVTTKSPLTGFIGDSNSGGDIGAELKYAGYDMIIIQGVSPKPVYLWINDDQIELRDANHLWGKTVFEARRVILDEIKESQAATIAIGLGGENQVRFANIIAELGRGSGRSGTGAVMGSKKLKAIAVRGRGGVSPADPELHLKTARKNLEDWRTDEEFRYSFATYGPTGGWAAYDKLGMFNTKNFQSSTFDRNLFKDLHDNGYFVKQKACLSCPLGCSHSFVIKGGPYSKTNGEAIELSQLGDFGVRVGNKDIELALKASTICDENGIDIFDMSSIIAFVMECYENGILLESDLDNLKPEWGDAHTILSLIEMTVNKQGIGSILADGLKEAAECIGKGSEKYAMHSKGQALVMREPRASKGWAALGYAVSSRGACHVRANPPEGHPAESEAWPYPIREIIRKYKNAANPYSEEGKAEIIKWYEDLRAFQNSMEICHFSYYPMRGDLLEVMAEYYCSVTGENLTGDELLRIGERIINLERAFNLREGLSRKDDSLPDRMLKEPLPDGPAKGEVVDLESMLDEYYMLRGWDKHTGYPTKVKLIKLGLNEALEDLDKIGKLG
ncbi:aldehyde ferredoxin oxidoreductase family protein [Thermodesulfobacteriota bacterium]